MPAARTAGTPGPARTDPRLAAAAPPGLLVGIVLAVLTFWLFAQTFVNVRGAVAESLGLDETVANLSVSITALFTGIFIVVAGGIADRIGRVRVLRLGLLLNIIGSLLVALTPSQAGALTVVMLLTGRIVQGLSAASVMPAGLALIKERYEGADRQRAISFFSIGTFGGSGLTAFVGGAIAATALGWRGIFAFSIAAAVTALVLLRRTPESRAATDGVRHGFDWTGLALFLVALVAINVYISQGPRIGWLSPLGLALIAATIIGLIVFVVVEQRRTHAFLDLSLFRIPAFTGAVVANFLCNCTIGALFIALSYAQVGAGWKPLQASLLTLGYLVAILTMIRVGEKLLQRFGAKKPMIWGMAILGLGVALCSLTPLPLGLWAVSAVLGLTLFGVGLGFFATPATDAALSSVPPEQGGTASGLFKMASSLGSATGLALSGAVFTALSAMDPAPITAWGLFAGAPEQPAVRFAAMIALLVDVVLLAGSILLIAVIVPGRRADADPPLVASNTDTSADTPRSTR